MQTAEPGLQRAGGGQRPRLPSDAGLAQALSHPPHPFPPGSTHLQATWPCPLPKTLRSHQGREEGTQGPRWPPAPSQLPPSPTTRTRGPRDRRTSGGHSLASCVLAEPQLLPLLWQSHLGPQPLAHQPRGPPGPPGLGPRLQLTAAGPSSATPLPTPHLTAHSLHLPSRPPSCSFPSASACPDVICRVCAQWLSRVRLSVTPWTVALQAPLSMEFSRQEYWSGQLFPSPGALPDSGIEPASLISPASAGRLFTPSATWEASGGDGHHLPLEASPEASYPSPGTRWILPCPGPWHPCT